MKLTNRICKKWLGLGMTFLLLLGFCGCGSASKSDQATMDYASATVNNYSADFSYGTYDTEAKYEAAEEAPASMESGNGAEVVQDTGRKLIKNVDMNVETRDFEGLIPLIEDKVANLGGYIENSNVYNGSTYRNYREYRYASMTIRIPQNQLETFIKDMQGVSNVTNCNRSVQDVTLTYVDLASHKKALQVEQDRLLELLEIAESLEDIITIESRLSDVRYQIESMEAQLRSYDNQVDYSTVYMNIEEVEVLTPVVVETTGERIVHGFTDSVKHVAEGIKEFFIGFIINLPYIVEWVIIIAVVVFVLVRLNRRRRRKQEQKMAQTKVVTNIEQNELNNAGKQQEKE